MIIKKKRYINYIILVNGATIPKKSLKFFKTFELFKDNYTPFYLQMIQDNKNQNLLTQRLPSPFLNKYKKN